MGAAARLRTSSKSVGWNSNFTESMNPTSGLLDRIRSWFRDRGVPEARVNLGCGYHFHPDWLNVDLVPRGPGVIAHNLSQPLPFDDASFGVVYHSHVLEHFTRAQATAFMRECFRILAPGGVIRVVVPDLEVIARLYLKYLERAVAGEQQADERYEWMTLELLDQLVREEGGGDMLKFWKRDPMPAEDFVAERMGYEVRQAVAALRQHPAPVAGSDPVTADPDPAKVGAFRCSGEVHKWMYDRWSLGKILRQVGFVEPRVCAPGESRIPDFNQYLLDLETDGSTRKPDSLFMEAIHPGSSR